MYKKYTTIIDMNSSIKPSTGQYSVPKAVKFFLILITTGKISHEGK